MKKLILTLAVFSLVVAACGDGDSGGDGGDGGEKPTITLIVNPWTASRLNAEVAKVIIEQEFGNEVEITEVNENDAMFTGMADGTLDAVLEIWPSGVTDAEREYFDAGTVNEIGTLGVVGKIGWFVPDYVINDHPELATWEGFADADLAKLFATAETGDNGRFLGTDPSYSQYDEQIIANLGLPFDVIFSGSEPATVAEVDTRVAAGEAIVLYWWTPTAAVAKYNLVNVALPDYNDACGASQASGDGGVDCDYPEDEIFKAASAKLAEKSPEVYAFLEAFTIRTEDQLEMLPPVEIDGDDPSEVAARWVSDHEDIWSAWISG